MTMTGIGLHGCLIGPLTKAATGACCLSHVGNQVTTGWLLSDNSITAMPVLVSTVKQQLYQFCWLQLPESLNQ